MVRKLRVSFTVVNLGTYQEPPILGTNKKVLDTVVIPRSTCTGTCTGMNNGHHHLKMHEIVGIYQDAW
jgi:hypothetical protein